MSTKHTVTSIKKLKFVTSHILMRETDGKAP
jgi:hypothetical protein